MITQHKRLKHPPYIDIPLAPKTELFKQALEKVKLGDWLSESIFAPLSGTITKIDHKAHFIRIENDRQDTLSDDFLSLNVKDRVRQYFKTLEPYERFSVDQQGHVIFFTYLSNEPFIHLDTQTSDEIKVAFKRFILVYRKHFMPTRITLVVKEEDRLAYEPYLGHQDIHYHTVNPEKNADHLYQAINDLTHQALKRNTPYQALGLHSLFHLNRLLIEETPPTENWFTAAGEGFAEATLMQARLYTPMHLLHVVLNLETLPPPLWEGLILREEALKEWPISLTKKTTSWYGKTPLQTEVMPCIECGRCVKHCPVNIFPQKIHKALTQNQNPLKLKPSACIGCGLCSFHCPSRIPLKDSVLEAALMERRYG